MDIRVGQTWRHEKRGSQYLIVSVSAHMQSSSDPHLEGFEDEPWVAYWPVANPVPESLYFRLRDEFLDGRFTLIAEAPE